jgi:catechol 2,3-dioxygenase-like lactoylglutathione lyase family enzyme
MDAKIQTFDHCGFPVDDITRAQKFYGQVLGAKPLWIANLNNGPRGVTNGWPLISFVEMGGHRFELCLAQEPLAPNSTGFPRIGFSVSDETMDQLIEDLGEAGVGYEGPISYPEAIPIKQTIRVRDADGNVLEFSTRK